MAAEFLAGGALDFDEPGVLMAFEETPEELAKNIASLGIDLAELEDQGKIFVDYVHVDRSEIEETGLYDLEGIFVRLADAISTEGARRVALDTIEALFSGFSDEGILRAELRLYVAGQTPKSLIAFANLKRICEDHLTGKYSIEVVDLLENPRLARGDQILAIPTLVRKQPTPMRKIIGDLSNTERVLVGLDLQAVG